MNDSGRKGDTVKPFNEKQGWSLLMKLLGDPWQDQDRRGLLKHSEDIAARELLSELGGVRKFPQTKMPWTDVFSSL